MADFFGVLKSDIIEDKSEASPAPENAEEARLDVAIKQIYARLSIEYKQKLLDQAELLELKQNS